MNITQVLESGYYDLHMHTTASDGIYSPRELVQKAHASGLKTIAITDHDTIEGIKEALQAGLEFGVNVIAGVEFSTKYKGRSVDILGYNVIASSEFNETMVCLREGRDQRAWYIVRKFVELGMPITMDDVKEFSKGNVIARPHIARTVVKKGYVTDYQTVFDEYLADGKPCAVDKRILSPREGIDLIHRAGGIAVLAHPLLISNDEFVRELMQLPFDGIEVWHRKHNKDDNTRYQQIAQEFHLIMTGGSDFHNDAHQLGKFGLEWKVEA